MPSQLNQGKIPAVELKPIIKLENGYGRHLAFGRDHHRWVSAQSGLFHIWQDLELKNTIVLRGLSTDGLHFSPNGQLLFISPYLFDLANNQLVDLPPLSGSLIAGIDPHQGALPELFEVNGAAWSPEGEQLVIYTQYRPPRGVGRTSDYSGPQRRLLLLDGKTRELLQILWEGSSYIQCY